MKNSKRILLYALLGVVFVFGLVTTVYLTLEQKKNKDARIPYLYGYVRGTVSDCTDTLLIVRYAKEVKPVTYVRYSDGSIQKKYTSGHDTLKIRNHAFNFRFRYLPGSPNVIFMYLANEGWPARLVSTTYNLNDTIVEGRWNLFFDRVKEFKITISGKRNLAYIRGEVYRDDSVSRKNKDEAQLSKLKITDYNVIKLNYSTNRFLLEKIYNGRSLYDPDSLQIILDQFDPSLRNSPLGKKLKKYIALEKHKSLNQ